MTISIGYPNPEDELQMMRRFRNDTPLESVISVITLDDILEAQKRVKEIFVSEPLEHYIIKLAHTTRNHDYIANGVSPRATLVLVRAVQALAFYAERILHTRRYTILVPSVWNHRIVLSMEGALRTTKMKLCKRF